MSEDDPTRALGELPILDADAASTERVHRAGAEAFRAAHAMRDRPLVAFTLRAARAVTPVVVVATVCVYLGYAVTAASALYP